MSELAALQWTAVGTMVLAVLTMVTAFFAIRAFQKQSEDVRRQGRELRREAAERRRAQVRGVFISVDTRGAKLEAHVENTSREPVYNVRVRLTQTQEDPSEIGTILPGKQGFAQDQLPAGLHGQSPSGRRAIEQAIAAVRFRFRDAAGVTWERGPNGELKDLGGPPEPEDDLGGPPEPELEW